MAELFNITQCNIAQTIAESNRFLFQVLLVHIATCVIEGKQDIFNDTLFKMLLITALAILMYHIFFRKFVEPKLEKMKMVCDVGRYPMKKIRRKLKRVHREDPLRPKYRIRNDNKLNEYTEKTQSRRRIRYRRNSDIQSDHSSERSDADNNSISRRSSRCAPSEDRIYYEEY